MTVKWPSKTYHSKVNGSAWHCCGDSLDKELFSILSLFTHMYKTNTRQCHVLFNPVTLYSIYFLQLYQQCHALFNRRHAPFERCHVFASLNRVAVNHSCYSCEIFAEQMIATEDGQNRHEEGSPRMPTKRNASSVCTRWCKFIKVTFNFCLFNFVTFSLLFFDLLSNSTTTR